MSHLAQLSSPLSFDRDESLKIARGRFVAICLANAYDEQRGVGRPPTAAELRGEDAAMCDSLGAALPF
jgi:hypothetical protein